MNEEGRLAQAKGAMVRLPEFPCLGNCSYLHGIDNVKDTPLKIDSGLEKCQIARIEHYFNISIHSFKVVDI